MTAVTEDTPGIFVGIDVAKAHLDIAASSWNTNSDLSTVPQGPLGAGTRLLVHLAELIAAA